MKNRPEDEQRLIEAVTTAWRPSRIDEIGSHPAWWDLDEAGRVAAFDATRVLRGLEANLDPDGLSTTARAVLARIKG